MQRALTILAMLDVHLPEIKQALGQQWPALAYQMRSQAALFEDLRIKAASGEDKAAQVQIAQALYDAANQLLGLFVANETARQILTRPDAQSAADLKEFLAKRFYLLGSSTSADRQPEPTPIIDLPTVANAFYLLCREPDQAAELTPPSPDQDPDPKEKNKPDQK